MSFGKRLKDLMFHRNMNQSELAEQISVGQSIVSRWIKGDREPSMGVAIRMADALQTSVDYLFGRTDDPSPPGSERFNPQDESWRENPNCPKLLLDLDDDPDFAEYLENPRARSILTGIAFTRGEMNRDDLREFLNYAAYIEQRKGRQN